MKYFKIALYLTLNGLGLFLLLPLSMLSSRVFDRVWNKYYVQSLPKNTFNLCVQWLLYHAERTKLTYAQINILIFCVIWPVITILSILLNVVLLCRAI